MYRHQAARTGRRLVLANSRPHAVPTVVLAPSRRRVQVQILVRRLSYQPSSETAPPFSETHSTSISSAIANGTFASDAPPNIFDLSSAQIQEFTSKTHLEQFVAQIEDSPPLTQRQTSMWVLPLARITSLKQYGEVGAQMTERLLWNCISKLPPKEERTDNHPIPPPALYNRAMIAWGNIDHHHERVETIFQWQVNEFKNDNRHPPPDRKSYKSRIRAWARHEPATAYKILRQEMEPLSGVPKLLQDTIDELDLDRPYTLELPDLATYNIVAMAYAKAPVMRNPIALNRILEIYDRVKRLEAATGNTGEYDLDGHSYVAILLALRRFLSAADRNPKTPMMTTGDIVGEWMEEIYIKIHNPGSMNLVKEAKREMDGNATPRKHDPDKPLFPLSMAWAYGVWIEAILRDNTTRENVERAERMIYDMMTGSSERKVFQCVPRQETIARVAKAWSRYPDGVTWIKKLLEVAVISRRHSRTFLLNSDMEEWANIPAPQEDYIPELLEAMLAKALDSFQGKHNKPTGQSFLIVMKSWMRCTESDAAPGRLENAFVLLVKLYEAPDSWYRPRESHVRYMFTAYMARCRTGKKYLARGVNMLPSEHCERILMWVASKNWLTPNHMAGICGMTLRAMAIQEGADDMDRLDRSMALLESFFAETGQNIPSYPANWVLTTCARDYQSQEAKDKSYQIASSIFVRNDIDLNHRSYELMVDVVKKQHHSNGTDEDDDETKDLLVQELFHRARSAGVLSQNMVIKFVRTVKTPDVIQKVFGVDYTFSQMIVQYSQSDFERVPKPLLIQNLPPEWSVNAKMRLQPGEKLAI